MTILNHQLCKSKTTFQKDRFQIDVSESILDVADEWEESAPDDVFFSVSFLRCVEEYPPSGIKPFYCVVKENDKAIGIVYLQLKYVVLKDNLRASKLSSRKLSHKAGNRFKKFVVEKINFHTIVCGNLMLTGKYGFHFNPNIQLSEQYDIVNTVTEYVDQLLRKENIKPGLILIKDLFDEYVPSEKEDFVFTKFKVQPKMIVDIRENWKTFDDYLNDMKSKYRVRAKKAFEKSAHITRKYFDAEDIENHSKEVMALYRNIADEAGFNAFILHDQYFANLKRALGGKMTFTTYWKDGKMIAFFTSIKNFDVLDAHFLGYDPSENNECQLYLNMLYDLVRESILQKVHHLDLSRTAIEIKSTVGAVPHDMSLYLKHANPVLNKAVKPILSFVKPQDEFVIRSPFREDV